METRFSPEHVRRKEMIKTLGLPTISQTKQVVGIPLSTIIFEQCNPDLKEDYGLEPHLKGPQGDLWVSPDDALKGKVVVSPPPTAKHIYALTHQAILDLGAQVDQKFENHMRIAKETAISELEEFLSSVFETDKAELLAELRREDQLKYGSELKNIRTFYEEKICQILWDCYEEVKELEKTMKNEVESLNKYWLGRVKHAVQETTDKLTTEFLDKMKLQKQVLVSIFTNYIRSIKEKKRCAIDFERTKCAEKIKAMKQRLQCQNLADLMYLLCKERRRCKMERKEIRKHYRKRVRQLRSTSNEKSKLINDLAKLKKKRLRQIQVRERCLIEILRQYQKFIYFALNAVPTQGEFLLNINQLLKFELEDYCLPQEESRKSIQDQVEAPITTEEDMFDYQKQIEEFLRYSQSVPVEEEFEHSDVLPAFYYKDKMYVREDFRDMFSAGLQMGKTNPLWNPDVEELLNIFRKYTEQKRTCQIEKVKSHVSSVRFDATSQASSRFSSESSISAQIQTFSPDSSPPGTPRRLTEEEKQLSETAHSVAQSFQDQTSKKSGKMSVERQGSKTGTDGSRSLTRHYGVNSASASRLTLARDSVILALTTIERKSLQGISKTIVETLEKTDSDAAATQQEDEEVETEEEGDEERSLTEPPKETMSKLLLATDSVELIKSKLDLTAEKEKTLEDGERKKSQLTFSPKVSVTESGLLQIPSSSKSRKGQPVGKVGKHLPHGSKKVSPGHKQERKSGKVTPKTTASVTSQSFAKPKVASAGKEKAPTETIEEYTEERITNLVNLIKKDSSLIRLFTPCHK